MVYRCQQKHRDTSFCEYGYFMNDNVLIGALISTSGRCGCVCACEARACVGGAYFVLQSS